MDTTKGIWFGVLAASSGLLIAAWSRARLMLLSVLNYFIVPVEVNDHVGYNLLLVFQDKYKKTSLGPSRYGSERAYVPHESKFRTVPFERMGPAGALFWNGWIPFWVTNSIPDYLGSGTSNGGGGSAPGGSTARSPNCVSVTYLRGTLDVQAHIVDAYHRIVAEEDKRDPALKARYRIIQMTGSYGQNNTVVRAPTDGPPGSQGGGLNERTTAMGTGGGQRRFEHVRTLVHDKSTLDQYKSSNDPMQDMWLPEEAEAVLRRLRHWFYSEDWYKARGLPWHRGVQLYGLPGTGKSAFAQALAYSLDLRLYAVDLSSMHTHEFTAAWDKITDFTPCIALFEDIDRVFDKDETTAGGVSFRTFINTIDGVKRRDGVIVIITANDTSKLDDALVRDGRIDYKVEMVPLNAEGRRKLAKRILVDWPHLIEETVIAGDGDTGAEYQNRCIEIASRMAEAEEIRAAEQPIDQAA